jgi:hypothetical protein
MIPLSSGELVEVPKNRSRLFIAGVAVAPGQ